MFLRVLALLLVFAAVPLGASELPTSATAEAAAERTEPALRDAFAAAGLQWGAPIFLRAFKESAELELWVSDGERFSLFRYIMIHGACGSSGCLSMTDALIEEIYTLAAAALEGGQPFFRVHVFPFRMDDEAMASHAASEWLSFWQNLREGYDWFEREGRPPNVEVVDERYVFSADPSGH